MIRVLINPPSSVETRELSTGEVRTAGAWFELDTRIMSTEWVF